MLKQVRAMVSMLLDFAQTNRGMTRVLIGDALVNENERLQERMNQLFERIEASIKQSFKVAIGDKELPESFDAERARRAGACFRVGPLAPIREERLSQGAGRRTRGADAGAGRLRRSTAGAHRAAGIARHTHRVPAHRQRVEHHQLAVQCLANPGRKLQCFGGLHRADNACQRRKHAHRRTQFVHFVSHSRAETGTRSTGTLGHADRTPRSDRRTGWRRPTPVACDDVSARTINRMAGREVVRAIEHDRGLLDQLDRWQSASSAAH